MRTFHGLRLSAYYLNTRRLEALSGAGIPVIAQESLLADSGDRAAAMRHAANVANEILKSGRLPNLNSLLAQEDVEGRRELALVWGVFTFRGLLNALKLEHAGKPAKP